MHIHTHLSKEMVRGETLVLANATRQRRNLSSDWGEVDVQSGVAPMEGVVPVGVGRGGG